jgi:Mg-chelatase subunit ChlI
MGKATGKLMLSLVVVLIMGVASSGGAAFAQGAATQPLPPALRAAVMSGNQQAVSAVIATLSAGNPQMAATLAASVLTAAEQLLASNPTLAVALAETAVSVVTQQSVTIGAPVETDSALVIASRIFVTPRAQAVMTPEQVTSANQRIATTRLTTQPASQQAQTNNQNAQTNNQSTQTNSQNIQTDNQNAQSPVQDIQQEFQTVFDASPS